MKSLKVSVGGMYSGKSTWLSNAYNLSGKVYAGKQDNPRKYMFKFTIAPVKELGTLRLTKTHDGTTFSVYYVNSIQDCISIIGDAKVDRIYVDEAQFIPDWENWSCLVQGRHVYVAALDMDFLKRPFKGIGNLLCQADEINKFHATCQCGARAKYSKRTSRAMETLVEDTGENYLPVCADCY